MSADAEGSVQECRLVKEEESSRGAGHMASSVRMVSIPLWVVRVDIPIVRSFHREGDSLGTLWIYHERTHFG